MLLTHLLIPPEGNVEDAVTRIGQTSPMIPHVRCILDCGYCGVKLSEGGLSGIRKPQVVRSIRITGSTFQSLALLGPTTSVSV